MAKRKSNVAKAASIVKMVANRREKSKESGALAAFVPDLPVAEVFAGVGGYGATRLGTKLGMIPVQRWPRIARHAPPAVAAFLFLVVLWLSGKLPKKYERLVLPIIVGSGVAVIHEALRTWMPGIGVLLGVDRAFQLPPQSALPARLGPQPAVEPEDDAASASYYDTDETGQPQDDEDSDLKTGIFAVK